MRALFLALFCCLLFTGCGQSESKLRIGVSIPAATHGWAGGVVWCAEQAEKRLEAANPGLDVIVVTSADAASQAERIENLLVRQVDALVVMAQEPGPITAVCEKAKSSGVYLVVVSNPLTKDIADVFVNGDNGSFGKAAGEAMGRLLEGKGDILVMEGIPCPINSERVNAFKKVVSAEFPGIRILDSQPAWWNTEKGLALMENYLLKFPKIDGVWAGDDDVLIGALKAYQESGRSDLQAFVGGGGSKNTVKQIKDRHPLVKATVTYPPQMIETAISNALEGLKNDKNPPDGKREIIVESKIVTSENAEDFYFPQSVY
jgi:ribose transport system substrate-binding protein